MAISPNGTTDLQVRNTGKYYQVAEHIVSNLRWQCTNFLPETMSTIQDLSLAGGRKAGPRMHPVVVAPQLEGGSCDTKMWGEGVDRWPPLQDQEHL